MWDEIEGDLIAYAKEGMFDVVSHGCNTMKNFGAGIALGFKKEYPLSYETDKKSLSQFGNVSICEDYSEVVIVNSYTQFFPGFYGSGQDTKENRYNAIRSCMSIINREYPNKHIGLPLIGCGYAGLEWDEVKPILQEELKDMKVTIVHYKK